MFWIETLRTSTHDIWEENGSSICIRAVLEILMELIKNTSEMRLKYCQTFGDISWRGRNDESGFFRSEYYVDVSFLHKLLGPSS